MNIHSVKYLKAATLATHCRKPDTLAKSSHRRVFCKTILQPLSSQYNEVLTLCWVGNMSTTSHNAMQCWNGIKSYLATCFLASRSCVWWQKFTGNVRFSQAWIQHKVTETLVSILWACLPYVPVWYWLNVPYIHKINKTERDKFILIMRKPQR